MWSLINLLIFLVLFPGLATAILLAPYAYFRYASRRLNSFWIVGSAASLVCAIIGVFLSPVGSNQEFRNFSFAVSFVDSFILLFTFLIGVPICLLVKHGHETARLFFGDCQRTTMTAIVFIGIQAVLVLVVGPLYVGLANVGILGAALIGAVYLVVQLSKRVCTWSKAAK